jgi:tRNA 2-thiouridine synthesizing protein B
VSMLHTVNKSPFERNALKACLGHALPESSVLLIEDGVYAAVSGTAFENDVREAMSDRKLYVLGPDLLARGLTSDNVIDGINVVDYAGFVELTEKHDKVQAWL